LNKSSVLAKLIFSGGLNQAISALVGLLRVPLVLGTFGVEAFASYTAAIGFWTLIAAVGESAKQRVRILEFSSSSDVSFRKIFFQSTAVAVIAGLALGSIFINFGQASSPDIGTFSVAVSCGILYVPMAMAMGRLEGRFKFGTANLSLAVGQIIGFFISVLACNTHQIWLVGFSVLFPFFLPGIISFTLDTRVNRKNRLKTNEINSEGSQKDSRALLLVVLLCETLVYAIDGALVLRYAGPTEAAIFAVVQRIVSVFAILPIVIAPLAASIQHSETGSKLKSVVQRIQVVGGVLLFTSVMMGGGFFFSFLAKNKLELGFWTLLAACGSGLVLALTTTQIQSATSSREVSLKALLTPCLAIVNIGSTIILSPIIGATAAFLSTGVGQIFYFAIIKRQSRKNYEN